MSGSQEDLTQRITGHVAKQIGFPALIYRYMVSLKYITRKA